MTSSLSDVANSLTGGKALRGPGPETLTKDQADQVALYLRIGLGTVFVIGGWWKLSRLISPERAGDLVARYTAPNGYINAFFQDYLFDGGLLTPWMFLTALSAFELIAGLALVLGLFVRPLAILFGLMMWSFVAALPVLTTPGLRPEESTYLTPAMIVQIRDIGLSGICFVLAMMGSGRWSLDGRLMNRGAPSQFLGWGTNGLLLRLSVAVVFLAGGAFHGLDHVKAWSGLPLLLIAIGVLLASGHAVRLAAFGALVVLAVYCLGAMSLDRSLWDNLNAIKREAAFVAASFLLIRLSGGRAFRVGTLLQAPKDLIFGERREVTRA